MSHAHMTRPCENCPYRKDAALGHWSREEFRAVLEGERGDFGRRPGKNAPVWACHKQLALAPAERGFCAGWLLDQKRRGVPSIALRIYLATSEEARSAIDQVDSDVPMYPTPQAMCRANGVRPSPRRRR
jgi:hypothetical protein